ncbi:MAG TPA: SMC-Scp complex subunit ScpB [Planctomycetota bacterium]|jgi:segregation and condensation protein B|nr:SMC-Scp complex subunit ScpB [Planctomycetota bacterium]
MAEREREPSHPDGIDGEALPLPGEALPVVEVVPGGESLVAAASTPEERDGPPGRPAEEGEGSPPPLEGEELARAALALVFASPDPVPPRRLAAALGADGAALRGALDLARRRLAEGAFPFELSEVGGGWRLLTDARYEPWIARLQGLRKSEKLSAAAVETLAIVAYRQPVTKAEIEAVRGVQVAPILRTLLERRFARVVGRAPVPGRPLQYGTTKEFLDRFGLRAIEELPRPEELTRV